MKHMKLHEKQGRLGVLGALAVETYFCPFLK